MKRMIFDGIGTGWEIDIGTILTDDKIKLLESQIVERIEEFDRTYSRFRADSFIHKLASKRGKYILPNDGSDLFTIYYELYRLTGGVFTPLIGKVLEDAGYDSSYTFKPRKLSKPLTWDQAMEVHLDDVHEPYIIIRHPSVLDFGAGGKGKIVDIISGLLRKNHVVNFCIDAGGDICYSDQDYKAIKVGLENPENPRQVIGIANISNQSICASAGNKRKWDKYHHIINPFSLVSPVEIIGTWVVAQSTILADCLSTCLFLVEPDLLLTQYDFQYIILYKDHSVRVSSGFDGEIFFNDKTN